MRLLTLVCLVPLAAAQHYMLNLDCTDYLGPCNNDCYAVYSANKPHILNYNGPGLSEPNRKAGGCTRRPCKTGKMALPNPDEDSCDEYPYASVIEGGSGTILRCTEEEENKTEGRQLNGFLSRECGQQACTFMVTFGNFYTSQTTYCEDGGGANDGFEYVFVNNKFQHVGRDINVTQEDGEFVLHEPDPADFFPPYLRREYLLEDGSRTLLPTRDLTTSYNGIIFYTFRNNTVYKLRAVRELFGSEKSPGLQFSS